MKLDPRNLRPKQIGKIGLHARDVSIGDAARRFGISRTLARRCLFKCGFDSRPPGNFTREEKTQIKLTKSS